MTEMIAQDLQDMANHPLRTGLSLALTILVLLSCPLACASLIFVMWK